jgi:oligopeptide transport system substrate-binding protein
VRPGKFQKNKELIMLLKSSRLILSALITLVASGSAGVATALDAKTKTVTINMSEEPRNMDPQKAQDTVAFMVLGHVKEGLTRMDPKNNVIPGQAESWEQLAPTKYRFKLRADAKWSDGKPVTSKDFVFAWRHGLDPATASLYAFILFPIKNAEKINKGELKIDQLGAKAIDDRTLEVELEKPTAYFLRLLSFGTYYPAREDFVAKAGAKYAAEADQLLYNGPWKLAEWKHNASMKLVKNPTYWNEKNIHINEINMPYLIRDTNTEFNMFKDGKFDLMQTIEKELLPDAQKNKIKILSYNVGTVWYLQFNTTRKVTGNKWIRRALSTAMDRNEIANRITGIPGTKPMYGFIPDYMPGVTKTYGAEYPLSFKDADIATAKKYLAQGLKELGLTKLPKLEILINDNAGHKRDAEYLQAYYKKALDIDIGIDVQTFKVRLQKTTQKEYDIVKSGWGPDYLDAMTFADVFTSWNTNNDSGWSTPEYDQLIRTAQDSVDQKVRLDAISKAEKILVEEAPMASMVQATRVYVQNPDLQGVIRRTISPDPDFYYARINEKVATKN